MADKTIAKLQSDNHRLTEQVNVKDQIIGELKPRADYTDKILQNKGLVTITQIAKDYGMTGQEMNQKLHELGIQYKQSGQWLCIRIIKNWDIHIRKQLISREQMAGQILR